MVYFDYVDPQNMYLNVKSFPRKRKGRDFYANFAKETHKNKTRRLLKLKLRKLLHNNKNMINNYVRDVAKGGHVFTLEDPEKWRTTNTLERAGIKVTALSTNPKILDRNQIHGYSTPFLQQVNTAKDKPNVCWLDYCGSVRRSNAHFDWVMDLEVCLNWIVDDGMVLLTFAKRGVPNYMSFVLHQIANLQNAHFVDIHEYQGENGAAMCVFTVVKNITKRTLLSTYMTPQEGQTVQVQDHTGKWTGVVHKQYTPNEFEIHAGEERCSVFRDEITHVVN